MLKKAIKEAQKETRKTTIALVLGGFGVVAALAWNDAIQSFFNLIFPEKGAGLIGKFFYAILITIIVVILSSRLKKFSEQEKSR